MDFERCLMHWFLTLQKRNNFWLVNCLIYSYFVLSEKRNFYFFSWPTAVTFSVKNIFKLFQKFAFLPVFRTPSKVFVKNRMLIQFSSPEESNRLVKKYFRNNL